MENSHKKFESSFVEKDALMRRELPEVTVKNKLKLLRVDEKQARFVDFEGQPWYFDSEERLWRKMVLGDIHPMALQFTSPEEDPEKKEFESVEEAARYALTARFRFQAHFFRLVVDDPKTKTEARADLQKYASLYDWLVAVLESIDRERDITKKSEIENELMDLLKN